jgi:hypothetical protein
MPNATVISTLHQDPPIVFVDKSTTFCDGSNAGYSNASYSNASVHSSRGSIHHQGCNSHIYGMSLLPMIAILALALVHVPG